MKDGLTWIIYSASLALPRLFSWALFRSPSFLHPSSLPRGPRLASSCRPGRCHGTQHPWTRPLTYKRDSGCVPSIECPNIKSLIGLQANLEAQLTSSISLMRILCLSLAPSSLSAPSVPLPSLSRRWYRLIREWVFLSNELGCLLRSSYSGWASHHSCFLFISRSHTTPL